MGDDSAEKPLERPATKAARSPAPARRRFAGWWRRVDWRGSPAYRASVRLEARSRRTFELARQVSAASPRPEDGAQLLRKAIYLLFLAVLRLEGEDPVESYDACRARIRASRDHRALFGGILTDLAYLEELWSSFGLTRDEQPGLGDRYARLAARLPRLYRDVRRRQEAYRRGTGRRLLRRRLVSAGVLLGVVALAALFVVRQTEVGEQPLGKPDAGAAAEPEVQVGAPPPKWLVDDPRRCFQGTYYADVDFKRPVLTRRDCRIEFNWGEESAHGIASLPPDGFAVRWEGLLRVPATGEYVFYVASDDGTRLYVDQELVIDNWGAHGLEEKRSRALRLRQGVVYPLRLDYFEEEGIAQLVLSWSSATLRRQPLSGRFVFVPTGDGGVPFAQAEPEPEDVLNDPSKCFKATYYSGMGFNSLVQTRRDCRIDFDWGTTAIEGIEQLPLERFSVRWEGILRVPETAKYVFYLSSDDGSRLYLGDSFVAGEWRSHSYLEVKSEPVELKAGEDYPLRVEFFEDADVAQIRLEWSSPALDRQPLSGRYVLWPPGQPPLPKPAE